MNVDTNIPNEQAALSMKKQLLEELWSEVRRVVEILNVARSENETLKQNFDKANVEIGKLKSQISDLEKILTSRGPVSANVFEEKEKERLVEAARDLISKIDRQLNLI